jgi:activator of HSP90 ATPase
MTQRFSTIRQTLTIKAKPDDVYDALMDSDKHAKVTGSPASISDKVGGKFAAWDGYIFGKNLQLVRGKKIVQEWSTTEWPQGYPTSRLEITLTGTAGGTKLKMVHSRVPAEQSDDYAEGWESYYWKPLTTYFEKQEQ